MIEEKFRQAVAEALAPLVERLEALEARLREEEPVGGELRTADPRHPLAPAQYASGGFLHGGSGDLPTAEPERMPEDLEPAPKPPARKRPSRAKSPSAPDA